jgi:hypothetical protein
MVSNSKSLLVLPPLSLKSSAPQNEPESVDRTNSLPSWVYCVPQGLLRWPVAGQ